MSAIPTLTTSPVTIAALTIKARHLHRWPDADAIGADWLKARFGTDDIANYGEVPVFTGEPDGRLRGVVVRIDLDRKVRERSAMSNDPAARETKQMMDAGVLATDEAPAQQGKRRRKKSLGPLEPIQVVPFTEDERKDRVLNSTHGHRMAGITYVTDGLPSEQLTLLNLREDWDRSSMGRAYYDHVIEPGRTPPKGLERMVKVVHDNDRWGTPIPFKHGEYKPIHPRMSLFPFFKKAIHNKVNRDPEHGKVGTYVERTVSESVELGHLIFDAMLYSLAEAEEGRHPEPYDFKVVVANWVCLYSELGEEDVTRADDAWEEELRCRKKFGSAWTDPYIAVKERLSGYLAERVFPNNILPFCGAPNQFPLENPEDKVFTLPYWFSAIYRYLRDVAKDRDAKEKAKAYAAALFDSVVWVMEDWERACDEVQAVMANAAAQAEAGEDPDWQVLNGFTIIRGVSATSQFASAAFRPVEHGGAGAHIVLVEDANRETGEPSGNFQISFRNPEGGKKAANALKLGTFTKIRQHLPRFLRIKELIRRRRWDLLEVADLNAPGDLSEYDPSYKDPLFVFVPDKWMKGDKDLGIPIPMWIFNGSLTHPKKPMVIGTKEVWRTIIEVVEAIVPEFMVKGQYVCAYRRYSKGDAEFHCTTNCPFNRADVREDQYACRMLRMKAHGGSFEKPGPDWTEADQEWLDLRIAKKMYRLGKGLAKEARDVEGAVSEMGAEDIADLLMFGMMGSALTAKGSSAEDVRAAAIEGAKQVAPVKPEVNEGADEGQVMHLEFEDDEELEEDGEE